jgi:molybdate transport system substrate-binding protein
LAVVLLVATLLGGTPPARGQPTPVVAAASDLQFALEEIAAEFRRTGGGGIRLSFGSSGNFHRQIQQGAPFQMFLSADEDLVLDLAARGQALDDGRLYAIGRIALLAPRGSPLKADATLADLRAALTDGRVRRFAIANPEHAPYGRAAEAALRHGGLWDLIQGRLVLGENVSQAAQFATSGSAQGGIVAYSLALAPQVARLADHALIPASWHPPLRQRMALLRGAGPVAQAFYEFVAEPTARAIFRRHGFLLPSEAG